MARRSRKAEEVLESLSPEPESFSNTDDESAPRSAAQRTAAKSRHVSLKQLAELLDRDRNTIMKWAAQGCPCVEKGDRDLGRPWTFDLAEVVKWREKSAAELAVEKIGGAKVDEESLRLRKMSAAVILAENDAAEAVKLVARVSAMLDLVRKDYVEIAGVMRSLPDAIASKVEARFQAKVRGVADEQVRSALSSLKAEGKIEDFLRG
jgi:phage terminase Nu1 subunit (DNA packaging protein)